MHAVAISVALILALAIGVPAALADDPIEDALARGAGPPGWVSVVGAWAAALAMLAVTALALRAPSRAKAAPRHWLVTAQLLAVWLFLGYVQSATARTTGTPSSLLALGYIVLPLALASVWFFVLANFRDMLRLVLQQRGYRWIAVSVAFLFAALYLWSSNLIGVPEADDLPAGGAPEEAFVVLFSSYGPLANWPNVEFWIPQLTLFGAVSVGVGMVVVTIAALMGLSWASVLFSLRRRGRQARMGARLGAFAAVGTVGTNFCCCCAPAVYPLLAFALGSTTASSLGAWLIGSSSPFYNLAQVGMIALMLATMSSLRNRVAVPPALSVPSPPA